MLNRLRLGWANLVTSGAHLALLGVGLYLDSREGWIGVLALISVISLPAWISSLRRYRLVGDTPTSRVASAAQGYVEFFGHAQQHPGRSSISKLTGLPCVWFRYTVERRSGDKREWERVDSGVSFDTFLLADDSGRCVVDPEAAEVITSRTETWERDGYRYTESLLLPQDRLYAIGEFVTLGGAVSELNFSRDMSELISQWKKDQPALLAHYDANRDGQLDAVEWERARRAARAMIAEQHREIRAEPGIHLLRRPRDGRLFLLSNLEPGRLARRYALWAWFHVAVFFMAGSASAALALFPIAM